MNKIIRFVIGMFGVAIFNFWGVAPTIADSSSPRLAAYYNLKLLLCHQTAYQWTGENQPKQVATNVVQVGVGRDAGYILTTQGRLLTWHRTASEKQEITRDVQWFAVGRSGVFVAHQDGKFVYYPRPTRWFTEGEITEPQIIETAVIAASIGDSADYYITQNGTLFVKGLAHRGQYGDGKLQSSTMFIPVANDVVAIKAHTGHAVLLKRDGSVMGTGGNIYGPLGRHGIGDKAITWGLIFKDATSIATGSSHTLAMQKDGSLWQWGRDIGLEPEKILDDVVAVAADRSGSIALRQDNSLWQWHRGQQPKLHFQCPKS